MSKISGRTARLMTTAASMVLLAACSGSADLSAVRETAQKPIKRYDVVQSLTSNKDVIVAGLQNGAVVVSDDKGKTWRREAIDGASMIGLATCPDDTVLGIDFHGKVWHADAKGQQWTSVSVDKPKIPLAVSCDLVGRWWVAGTRSGIAYSEDKGANWHSIDLGEDAQITAIQFLDRDYGVATAEFGMVYVTEDGGASWNRRTDMPNEFYPYDAMYVSRELGYVSGLAGQMLKTEDGGQSWLPMDNATGAPMYRLFMLGGVPHGVGASGVVARLEGDTWRAVAYPDPLPVFFAAGAPAATEAAVIAGGPGGLLRVIAAAGN